MLSRRQAPMMRSLLFVPGSRPDRFSKAMETQADCVIFDLEDSVLPEGKAQAREDILAFLERFPAAQILVRTNSAGTPDFKEDLILCKATPGIVGVVLPKAETATEVEEAAETGKGVWPLIETAKGYFNLSKLSNAQGVDRLTFGAVDLCVNLGLTPGSEGAKKVLDEVRIQLVLHASASGLSAPIDSVTTDIHDLAKVRHNAMFAYSMGMRGMLCIHPNQVPIANEVFMPSQEDVVWARRVMELAGNAGAFQLDGEMVDAPVIARAKDILEKAGH